LFYTDAEIKHFKAEIRHTLKRRVFFDLKNSVVHTTPIVPGDQFCQLYYTTTELDQLERDFVNSVKLEHGVDKEWNDNDDQKPIALLVLERAKLREKYCATIRNKLVRLKVGSLPPPADAENSERGLIESSERSYPRSATPRRIHVSSTSSDSETMTTQRIDKYPKHGKVRSGSRRRTCSSSNGDKPPSNRSRNSESVRGPNGLGLERTGSGIAIASRRSSIELVKRHQRKPHTQQPKTRAMAA